MDILKAEWIDKRDLKEAIDSIKSFEPTILVVTKKKFDGYINALKVHNMKNIKTDLESLGIKRIIWAEDLKENEFELSSEESWQKLFDEQDIETLTLK